MIKEKTKKIHIAKVSKIEAVCEKNYYIEFETKSVIESKPGQYVSILCGGLTLRRPFSIAFHQGKTIGVIFKEKGEGTAYIKSLKIGDSIDFIGPLGNGFDIKKEKSLLIGAGIGVAPIFYLKTRLDSLDIESCFMGGFLNNGQIPTSIKCDKIITNDGSFGEKGSVLDHVENAIEEVKPSIIYACGPRVVLQKVCDLASKHSIPVQIAMEKEMACGIGVCRGCVIKIKKDGIVQNATVCKDGPVFEGKDVIWTE